MPRADRSAAPALPILAFAGEPGADGVSEPFEVIRAGRFVRGERRIELAEADLDAMVANFRRWQQANGREAVPIDYDHSFAEGGESRAAGWMTDLVRRGRSLFARVRWTDKAAELIRSREYRFFSPEWTADFVAEDGGTEGPTMIAGALTNRPFLRGMTPVALSQEVAAEAFAAGDPLRAVADAVREEMTRRGMIFAGDETRPAMPTEETTGTETPKAEGDAPAAGSPATPEAPAAASGDAPAAAAPAAPAAETASQERGSETVTMTRSEADELRSKAGQTEDLRSQIQTMSSRLDTIGSELATERFTADFAQAQREGRVDAKPETRETWRKRYEKFGRDDARALLFEMPAETIAVSERGTGAGSDAPVVPEGTDAEAFALDRKAREAMKADPKLSYEDALERVEQTEGAEV